MALGLVSVMHSITALPDEARTVLLYCVGSLDNWKSYVRFASFLL